MSNSKLDITPNYLLIADDQKMNLNETSTECVQCPITRPVCPKCPDDKICIVSVRTCDTCPSVSCVGSSTQVNKSATSSSGSSTPIGLIVGIAGGVLLVLIIIIIMIARKSFNKKMDESFHYKPKKSPSLLEKGEKNKMIKKKTTKKGLLFNPFSSNHSRRMSTSFSMLNFDCYDESELEQEMSFEEMLKTDPKKFLGPNRPKSSFRGKKISELPKYAQQQRRLSINTSRDTLVNSSLDIKVHDDDYKPDFGNVFKGFDINYFQEDEK